MKGLSLAASAPNAAVRRRPRLWRTPLAIGALAVLILAVIAAVLAPWIAPADPYETALRSRLKPPSAQFWLGTDSQGRDLLTRLLYGLRTTLSLGFAGVALGAGLGVAIGLCAAFYTKLDGVLMRIIDVLLSFPSILFGLSLAAIMGPGLDSMIVAIGLSVMPGIARVSRGASLSIMAQDYMNGGKVIGLPDRILMTRYLLANAFPPILTYVTLAFGDAVLLVATLGFLGLGLQPPAAELGSIASEGRTFLFIAPHVTTFACAAIFLIVLSVNLLGDAMRDAADRRSQ